MFQLPLHWEVVGDYLEAMAIQGSLFLLFTLLLQHRNCFLPQSVGTREGWQGLRSSFGPMDISVPRPTLRTLRPLGKEDEDVAHERQRVVGGATRGDVLVLQDLTKAGAEC